MVRLIPKSEAPEGPKVAYVMPHVKSRAIRQLRIIMARADFTRDSIIEVAGYSKNLVSRWFNGANTPRLAPFEDICEALGFEVVLVPIEGFEYADGTRPLPIYGAPRKAVAVETCVISQQYPYPRLKA